MSINLTPWREERRKRRQKDFANKIGISAIIALGLVVVLGMSINGVIDGQQKRNDFLKQNIDVAQKNIIKVKNLKKKKEEIISREEVIKNLQSNRDLLPQVFYQLAANSVDGIINTHYEYKNNQLVIKGFSVNNSSVADYINRLKGSPWFKKPEIIIIEARNIHSNKNEEDSLIKTRMKSYRYSFIIQTQIQNPDNSEDNKNNEIHNDIKNDKGENK